jgi:lysophospholipase L1-like esterase
VVQKNLIILEVFLLNVFICAQVSQISGTKTVYMIGNSTMADKPYKGGNPEKGWGQIFPLYFKEGIEIENHAVNGRSTKSFLDEGRWSAVLDKINVGDYVIIGFGHNDSKKDDPKRFADANTDYRTNLIKIVNETRSKGGIPILATPIVRRRFDEQGKFYDVHGDYPKVVREVALNMNVILLDMHKRTEEMLIEFGEEKSKLLFLLIDPTEYKSLPEGRTDNTHLSAYGAFKVCDLAAEEIRNLIPELASFLKD